MVGLLTVVARLQPERKQALTASGLRPTTGFEGLCLGKLKHVFRENVNPSFGNRVMHSSQKAKQARSICDEARVIVSVYKTESFSLGKE